MNYAKVLKGNDCHEPKGSSKGGQFCRSQARVGGETAASNGYFYKGGQFLPSTEDPPGTYRIGKKRYKVRREEVAPGEFAEQPTPTSRAIYPQVAFFARRASSGALEFIPGAKDATGASLDVDKEVRFGIKGFLGKNSVSLRTLLDRYNQGERWFDIGELEGTSLREPKLDRYVEGKGYAHASSNEGWKFSRVMRPTGSDREWIVQVDAEGHERYIGYVGGKEVIRRNRPKR
jgi:hypothetical protein